MSSFVETAKNKLFRNNESEQVHIPEKPPAPNRQLESEADKANPPVVKPDLLQLLGEQTETQNKQTHAMLQQHVEAQDKQTKGLLEQYVS